MKISLLQMDLAWADPAKNRATAARLIDACPGSDLYILPEMFSTGFATKPEGIAEADGASVRWMRDMAHRTGAAVCGSIATEEDGTSTIGGTKSSGTLTGDSMSYSSTTSEDGSLSDSGKFYNRFFFVKPDGTTAHYDKRHLFTYSGEDKRYTRGSEHVVVEWGGFRIMPQVCYDLRFPVWARNRMVKAEDGSQSFLYDMLVYVASWPESRQTAWDTLLRARAIENQCWVAGVNRVGKDPGNIYVGGSVLIDPWGNTVASCIRGAESVATADIDLSVLTAFRKQFPVLADAD